MGLTGSEQFILKINEGDSPEFIHIVQELLNRLAVRDDIAEIRVIRVKNWFDHKWLNYSGKKIIHYEYNTHPDMVALTHTWNDKKTVPPFNPSRILSEGRYLRNQPGKTTALKRIHIHMVADDKLIVDYLK